MPYGYNGKILRVDLSSQAIFTEEPDESFYRTYLGGKGFGSYFLLRELKHGIDPLSSENKLIFADSVITGAPAPGINRYSVIGKSPLSSGLGESDAGGWWGPQLKFAGFDAIIIEGRSENPVYIFIHDEQVQFKDARRVWGLNTGDTQKIIRGELGSDRIQIATIGPAGENQVRYACITNGLIHVNGRSGLGAVMGSKNLKAIAVRGSRKINVKKPETVTQIAKWFAKNFKMNPIANRLHEHGTHATIDRLNSMGLLPTGNYGAGEFDLSSKINSKALREAYSVQSAGCFACSMRCKKIIVGNDYGAPEYETVAAFGSNLKVSNMDVIVKANQLCNQYGLDTISTGVSIAFAMECVERGILSEKDLEGLNLKFGNDDSILEIIERIALRKGIGTILAEGVRRASEIIGKNSAEFAMHVKGQETPLHDPRGKFGLALGFAISETGADHNTYGPHDNSYELLDSPCLKASHPLGILEPMDALDSSAKKVRFYLYEENLSNLWQTLGVCNFVPAPRGALPLQKFVELVEAITGYETSLWELLKAGERTTVLSRSFNAMEGFGRKEDSLPNRFFEPLEAGLLKGKKIEKADLEEALTTYYRMRGYDDNGKPTKAKLQELDIEWVAERIAL
jgi:aldehyde:ferredoxin oxidoreductase